MSEANIRETHERLADGVAACYSLTVYQATQPTRTALVHCFANFFNFKSYCKGYIMNTTSSESLFVCTCQECGHKQIAIKPVYGSELRLAYYHYIPYYQYYHY